jgi:hypothetical protein
MKNEHAITLGTVLGLVAVGFFSFFSVRSKKPSAVRSAESEIKKVKASYKKTGSNVFVMKNVGRA